MNPKGEMKGSAITGPVGKEAAELWPVCVASHFVSSRNSVSKGANIIFKRIASNSGVVM